MNNDVELYDLRCDRLNIRASLLGDVAALDDWLNCGVQDGKSAREVVVSEELQIVHPTILITVIDDQVERGKYVDNKIRPNIMFGNRGETVIFAALATFVWQGC